MSSACGAQYGNLGRGGHCNHRKRLRIEVNGIECNVYVYIVATAYIRGLLLLLERASSNYNLQAARCNHRSSPRLGSYVSRALSYSMLS